MNSPIEQVVLAEVVGRWALAYSNVLCPVLCQRRGEAPSAFLGNGRAELTGRDGVLTEASPLLLCRCSSVCRTVRARPGGETRGERSRVCLPKFPQAAEIERDSLCSSCQKGSLNGE